MSGDMFSEKGLQKFICLAFVSESWIIVGGYSKLPVSSSVLNIILFVGNFRQLKLLFRGLMNWFAQTIPW